MSGQPLYAHWRPLPVAASGASQRKGPQGTGHQFTPHNARSNEVLSRLHEMLRRGQPVQHEIDRYLAGDVPLPRSCAPHYENLPDMGALATGVLHTNSTEGAEYQVVLTMRQCTPLRRRTKRAQREVQWKEESYTGMQHLLRCTQGTLLGLYAHCAQSISFSNRAALYQLLRSMLVLDFHGLNACMQRLRYTVKIAIMEHFCNTVVQLNPAVSHMLNKSGQQVQLFREAVNMLCDMFRVELNTALSGGPDVLLAMEAAEKLAHSYFERCTRAYRGVITGSTVRMCSMEFVRGSQLLQRAEQLQWLHTIHQVENQYVFNSLYKRSFTTEWLTLAWHVMQCIKVHTLPECLIERQQRRLVELYPKDEHSQRQATSVYLCMYCAIKRPATQSMLRLDCTTMQLMCSQCETGEAVLSFHLLGRVLSLGQTNVVLSACCCKPIEYTGSGDEHGTACGAHCANRFRQCAQRSRRAKNAPAPPANKPLQCVVCKQHSIAQTLELIDVEQRCTSRRGLCAKHVLPEHLARGAHDEASFQAALRSASQTHF